MAKMRPTCLVHRVISFLLSRVLSAAVPSLKAISAYLYPPTSSYHVYRITRCIALKSGPAVRISEAEAMRFVAANTTIPVPRVIYAWTSVNGHGHILMEWIPECQPMQDRLKHMSREDKLHVGRQLGGFINQLRLLPQPDHLRGLIGPVDGSQCWDERLKSQLCGPFHSEQAFNEFRLSLVEHFSWEEGARRDIAYIRDNLRNDHKIVFTHGDINHRNILLDDSYNVVGLIDWEMSGWMPEYWEYVKTLHGYWEDPDWVDVARVINTPYDAELEIDNQYIILNGGAPF